MTDDTFVKIYDEEGVFDFFYNNLKVTQIDYDGNYAFITASDEDGHEDSAWFFIYNDEAREEKSYVYIGFEVVWLDDIEMDLSHSSPKLYEIEGDEVVWVDGRRTQND